MHVEALHIEKRSWVEVNLSQLRTNYQVYRDALGHDVEIMAVIKADAYGHGDVHVARLLGDCGVKLFAVSNIDEAITLREAGVKGEILILGYTSTDHAQSLFDYSLTQALVSVEHAEALRAKGLRIKCQFAIDTGMNRIGLDADDSAWCADVIRRYASCLALNGLFTHLCVADTDAIESVEFTRKQISKFKDVVKEVADLHLPYCHCCNSAGGLAYLNLASKDVDVGKIVRLGIILYGLKPDISNELPAGIRPVLSWKSRLSLVKRVRKGETIGYGRTYRAESDRIIATVTTGYADGYSRRLSNRGIIMLKGCKAPIVGRVCMDQIMVDVTDIPDAKAGDEVVLLGCSGEVVYTADDMAKDLDTIGYEIVCGISKRVQRFYVNDGKL